MWLGNKIETYAYLPLPNHKSLVMLIIKVSCCHHYHQKAQKIVPFVPLKYSVGLLVSWCVFCWMPKISISNHSFDLALESSISHFDMLIFIVLCICTYIFRCVCVCVWVCAVDLIVKSRAYFCVGFLFFLLPEYELNNNAGHCMPFW